MSEVTRAQTQAISATLRAIAAQLSLRFETVAVVDQIREQADQVDMLTAPTVSYGTPPKTTP